MASRFLCIMCYFSVAHRNLDSEDFVLRVQEIFSVDRPEAVELLNTLMECMEHREAVSEKPELLEPLNQLLKVVGSVLKVDILEVTSPFPALFLTVPMRY